LAEIGYSAAFTIGQNIKMLMPTEPAAKHDNYLANYRTGRRRDVDGASLHALRRRAAGTRARITTRGGAEASNRA